MNKTMRIGFLVVLACMFFSAIAFAETTAVNLFRIERNTNANIVQYDVNITNGEIDASDPVISYWVLHARGGGTAPVTALQRRAYGFRVSQNQAGHFDFVLTAVRERPMKIYLVNGIPKAEITINDRPAFLQRVFVDATNRATGIPRVNFYILTGIDIETGQEIYEQINVRD
ncbi:MAG: DUF4833 domain-containing protein [Elusimicrobia bacterium]|nr:DUF4833 domain-containing protein [Elusimicrobiota bacterium]